MVGKEDTMTPASKATAAKTVAGARPRAATKTSSTKKAAPAKVGPAKKATVAKSMTPATKAAPKVAAKKGVPVKKAAPASKAAPKVAAKKGVPVKKAAPASKAAPAKKSTAPAKKAPLPATKAAPVAKAAVAVSAPERTIFTPKPKPPPPVRPKTGPYAKDLKFLGEIRELLLEDRAIYQEQATSLRAEADSLALEREPGDVQFDEESGEGGTVTVDRERNLALSGQAALAVEEIDYALVRVDNRTYGYCERCFQPIPKPRLRALTYARLCVACKSGGLSRR
jgi:RNA polymerase-binding transcription factor DksA